MTKDNNPTNPTEEQEKFVPMSRRMWSMTGFESFGYAILRYAIYPQIREKEERDAWIKEQVRMLTRHLLVNYEA